MKITKQLHARLEELFKAMDYKIRYEKGTFRSGYCILQDQNVIVVNKFFPMESKVTTLVEILRQIEINPETVDPKDWKFIEQLRQTELQF
jgi:hypothetical protein